MKKDAYIFKTDDVGREYVEMKYNEKLKNHQGTENTENMDSKPRRYASGKEENNCPVKSLKLYLSKLNPDNELLFQQPKQKVKPDDEIWYTSRPVGAKTISGFMSKLSTDAKLSKRYTNHCIRATTITLLSHAGVSNRAITRITKHRNEESLKHYERDSSDEQKRQFGDILLQEVSQPKQPQGGETEEYMNLMNMDCYLPNRPTLPPSTINETSASEATQASQCDSHGVYRSVCRPARPATATSSNMYQRQSERRNQSSTYNQHYYRGVHRSIHPATATSSSMYRRPGSENTNTCCPYNQHQPLVSSTTVMSNRQYPHFQNPYSFEQCSVTVQNHYYYN